MNCKSVKITDIRTLKTLKTLKRTYLKTNFYSEIEKKFRTISHDKRLDLLFIEIERNNFEFWDEIKEKHISFIFYLLYSIPSKPFQ